MVPIRLQLKNFMSYGENAAPVEFEGMHVACLSGENGHGKTALLDAITWALWGQARAGTEQLIRAGSDEMSVTFDFELGGNLYRVIKAVRRKRNTGMWELSIAGGTGEFRSITGQGIRDTGRQIQKLLRMDYRTFINSAYIQQGKADEFTRQTVGDRKKVLADILDLSRYDRLSQKAKEARDAAHEKVDALRREMARLDVELFEEERVRESLADVDEHLAHIKRSVGAAEFALKTLEKRKAELEAEKLHTAAIRQEMVSTEAEIRTLEERHTAAVSRVQADEAVVARADEVHEGRRQLEDCRRRDAELVKVQDRLRILQLERSGVERIVETEKHHLDLRLKLAENELGEALARLKERPYLESEIETLRSRAEASGSNGNDTVSRGVCDPKRRIAQAEQVLFLLKETEETLPRAEARVMEIRAEMDLRAGNGSDGNRLQAIDREICELSYDPLEHSRIKEDEAELRRWEKANAELEHAELRLPDDRRTAQTLLELIDSKRKLVQSHAEQLQRSSEKLEQMSALEQELEISSTELQALRAEETSLASQKAVCEHLLAEYEELKRERSIFGTALVSTEADLSAYTDLAKAFGRSGVQSLIIENAVPEIQEEANDILLRMTDGAMSVSLETMRETKTSGAVETLDIRVRDEMGERAYDLLSGGEAFRVNFALRIALSKLLARRAGAKLETLVIDEGFGTQDGKGREKLVEAIDSVKEEFRRILVITHIEELKDAFPTRLEVVKDQDGSQVTVV